MGEVIADIEARVQAERDRVAAKELERIQRQREWEEAMDRARVRFHEDRRVKMLNDQLAAWEKAARIRTYCAAMEAAGPEHVVKDDADAFWRQWCLAYADRIDPTIIGASGPADTEPRPEDLRPYLGKWNPYGP